MMTRLVQFLDLSQINASGKTWAESLEGAQVFNDDVIRTLDNAIYQEGALAVLKGNLAPDGCVMKPSAAAPHLLKHSGPALVFDDYPALKAAIDRDDLDVTPDHVLVLRNAGPLGGPGMPEWGMLPIPKKLIKQGVRDMLRISDARMSGTSYGACILHVAPESYVGGPLALVQTGDIISVDVVARTLNLDVPEDELARRRAALTWLWLDVLPPYQAGRSGLRLRLSGNRFWRTGLRTGHILNGSQPCLTQPHATNSKLLAPQPCARLYSKGVCATSLSRTCIRLAPTRPKTWWGKPSPCAIFQRARI